MKRLAVSALNDNISPITGSKEFGISSDRSKEFGINSFFFGSTLIEANF